MNQILFNKFLKEKTNNISISYTENHNKISIKKRYIFLLVASIFIFLISFSYIIYLNYSDYVRNIHYSNYSASYDISKLYSSNNSTQVIKYEKPLFNIIGIIKIDKLKICYTILSEINDDLLKIAPCKFSGPNPNEVRKPMYCWS